MEDKREELERRYSELLREQQGWRDALAGTEYLLEGAIARAVAAEQDRDRLRAEIAAVRASRSTTDQMHGAERRASEDMIRRLRAERASLLKALRRLVLADSLYQADGDDPAPYRELDVALREAQEVLLILDQVPPV